MHVERKANGMTTSKGFKLFEMDTEGNLYPLFIDKQSVIPIGEWIEAKICPTKRFAVRPGFHLGLTVDAPWLKDANGQYKGRRKGWRRVWAECEYVSENNYDEIVAELPNKCFTDRLPTNGFYRFKESGVDRWWIICDKIKVIRILSEDDRKQILDSQGYDEEAAFLPYKKSFEKRMKRP